MLTDLFGTLDPLGAEVSVANASWWLVVGTFLAAGGAVWVVRSAFRTQARQWEQEDRLRETEREAHRARVVGAISRAPVFDLSG